MKIEESAEKNFLAF